MEIKTVQDWPAVDRELQAQIKTLNFNPDLYKMKRNLDNMVRELSKSEVEARRIKNYRYLEPHVAEVNQAITQLEQWIFLLLLRQ